MLDKVTTRTALLVATLMVLAARLRKRGTSDAGMSTVEYAIGTIVAAAFAAVLYKIVTGDSIVTGLTNLIQRAFSAV